MTVSELKAQLQALVEDFQLYSDAGKLMELAKIAVNMRDEQYKEVNA